MRKVFLDMDGVFFDFERGFTELTGVVIGSIPKKECWKLINNHHKDIFSKIPLIPGAKNFLLNIKTCGIYPTFLSACPNSFFIQAAQDKRRALREKLETTDPLIPCIQGEYKAGYIENPGDILIDDKLKNIESWRKHGGIGIHHVQYSDFQASFTALLEAYNATST